MAGLPPGSGKTAGIRRPPARLPHPTRARATRASTLHALTLAEVLVGPARNGAEHRARQALADAGIRLAAEGDPDPEMLARVRATAALTMPDACVLAQAEHLGAPLATFDKRLAREARARGTIVLDASLES